VPLPLSSQHKVNCTAKCQVMGTPRSSCSWYHFEAAYRWLVIIVGEKHPTQPQYSSSSELIHVGWWSKNPERQSTFRAEHEWIRGFLTGSGIYLRCSPEFSEHFAIFFVQIHWELTKLCPCQVWSHWAQMWQHSMPNTSNVTHRSQKGKLTPAQLHFSIIGAQTWQKHNSVNF